MEPVSVTTCQLPLDEVDSCRWREPGTEIGLVRELQEVIINKRSTSSRESPWLTALDWGIDW